MATIRQHLAKIYEEGQQWREAARVLTGIPLETGQRFLTLYIENMNPFTPDSAKLKMDKFQKLQTWSN